MMSFLSRRACTCFCDCVKARCHSASEGADWLINPSTSRYNNNNNGGDSCSHLLAAAAAAATEPSPKVENRRFNGRFPIIEWYVHHAWHRALGVRYGNYGLR